MQKLTYRHTLVACYTSYVVQAIANNLSPLLFIIFNQRLGLSLGLISSLVVINFAIQMSVDFFAAALADKLDYRFLMTASHICAAVGVVGLGVFPHIMPPYLGLVVATSLCAVGGGLLETLVSPLLEALPLENKAAAMSLLHSFYCWGHMAVVLLSTLFFVLFGKENYALLPLIWAILPLINAVVFTKVPVLCPEDNAPSMPKKELVRSKTFWLFMAIMLCAGASEQAMSQWASAFAESGLGVDKTVGDLLGPCMFALFMGSSRAFYGKMGDKINLRRFMIICGFGCTAAYAIAALSPVPLLSLAGCGLCGLCVGIMWPGAFSIASRKIPAGGTAMFALLALGGDIGCSSGPALVGLVGSIRGGLGLAIVFPLLLVLCLVREGKTSEE